MSKADKMFEELGYKTKIKSEIGQKIVHRYYKDDDNVIHFIIDKNSFYKSGEFDGMHDYITMQELQAINEKVKELGWYE